MRRIALLDAPSNLGLRPPTPTSTPGCAKAPGALRDHGILGRLVARDAGCLTAPRYDAGDWRPGDGVAHAAAIAAYSVALAGRIGAIIDNDEFPVVLGGDCSIMLGSALAMHRLGEAVGGRIGLVYVDGHSDFRHPGNASYVGAAAGEGLALATGRGQADLAAIEGRRPYFRDVDVVVLGIRAQDEYRLDLQAAGILTRPVPALRAEGAARTAQWARDQLADCAGYWVHIDVDVLDPAVMPAVDAPDPGGIAFAELELLIAGLVDTPHCLGIELTVFDPDYDPDGAYAAEITSAVVAGLAPIRAARSASPLAFTPRRRPAPDAERFRPPVSAVPSDEASEPPASARPAPTSTLPAARKPRAARVVALEPAADEREVTGPASTEPAAAGSATAGPGAGDLEAAAGAERVLTQPTAESEAATEDGAAGREPARRPAIGRQRRSAFDVIAGDADPARQRRSVADILAAPLGGDTTGPGRLRRPSDGDPTDARPGGLRRSKDSDSAQPDARPGGLRRSKDSDSAPTDARPGGLRRSNDSDSAPADARPGSLRRNRDSDSAAEKARPGGLRRKGATPVSDTTTPDIRPGGLRPRPSADEGDEITTDARPGKLRRANTPDDEPSGDER